MKMEDPTGRRRTQSPLLMGCHLSQHMLDKYPPDNAVSTLGYAWWRMDVKNSTNHQLNLLRLCQPGQGRKLLTLTHTPFPPQRCLEGVPLSDFLCAYTWVTPGYNGRTHVFIGHWDMLPQWSAVVRVPKGRSWKPRTLLMKGVISERPGFMSWHKLHCSTGFYL